MPVQPVKAFLPASLVLAQEVTAADPFVDDNHFGAAVKRLEQHGDTFGSAFHRLD